MSNGFPDTKKVQLAALRSVIDPDLYADFRKICRWFSRTFATPLSEVYDLPSDFILQHYLEDRYENMEHSERRDLLIELTETPQERIERLRKEAEQDHKSFTQSKESLDGIMAKISKMKGSDIKAGLDTYRAELEEKRSVKQEEEPTAEEVASILSKATMKSMDGGVITPDSVPLPPKATPPIDYPDYELKIDESQLNGIDLDADSMSLPKSKKR